MGPSYKGHAVNDVFYELPEGEDETIPLKLKTLDLFKHTDVTEEVCFN